MITSKSRNRSDDKKRKSTVSFKQINKCFYHLQQSQISNEDIVEVDLWIGPSVVEMRLLQADGFVGHLSRIDQLFICVDAASEPTAEQVDSHDAEDEPEDQADQQYVEDRWDRLN